MKQSVKGVLYLLYGVTPLFFAFLFGGYCMFHEHEKFDTLTKTNATLQAILTGDEIMNFILPLKELYGAQGLIYSMAFCIFFIICIHNVLVYIISEAFKIMAVDHKKENPKLSKRQSSSVMNSPDYHAVDEKDPRMMSRVHDNVAAEELYQPHEVVMGEDNINHVKTKVFNKIIPQSRDRHIIDMTTKKAMIKDDIRYLKQSIQDLEAEKLDEELKAHLLLSCRLYVEFLIKRLDRMTRIFIDNEEIHIDDPE